MFMGFCSSDWYIFMTSYIDHLFPKEDVGQGVDPFLWWVLCVVEVFYEIFPIPLSNGNSTFKRKIHLLRSILGATSTERASDVLLSYDSGSE